MADIQPHCVTQMWLHLSTKTPGVTVPVERVHTGHCPTWPPDVRLCPVLAGYHTSLPQGVRYTQATHEVHKTCSQTGPQGSLQHWLGGHMQGTASRGHQESLLQWWWGGMINRPRPEVATATTVCVCLLWEGDTKRALPHQATTGRSLLQLVVPQLANRGHYLRCGSAGRGGNQRPLPHLPPAVTTQIGDVIKIKGR